MSSVMKKMGLAALAALSIAGATLVTSSDAEARWRGGGGYHHGGYGGYHRGGGGFGPGFVGGLAIGALASRPYGYGYGGGYGAYGGGYGYNNGCIRRRVVGYNYYGRPIVRAVNVCY